MPLIKLMGIKMALLKVVSSTNRSTKKTETEKKL